MKTNIVKCIFTVAAVLAMTLAIGAGAASAQGNTPGGTVKDGGLVWLKNANCFAAESWNQAMSSAASLKSGMCGLTDGSMAGQWRLPTKDELVQRSHSMSEFSNVQNWWYWTSSNADKPGLVWAVDIRKGKEYAGDSKKSNTLYVLPVRAK